MTRVVAEDIFRDIPGEGKRGGQTPCRKNGQPLGDSE